MTAPRRPYELHSPILKRHGLVIARECVDRCAQRWPELIADRRARIEEDLLWHLDHLDSAVEADAPEVFDSYADWLVGLLGARGVAPAQIAEVFSDLAEAIDQSDHAPRRQAHRRALVALLRRNQKRILDLHAEPGP